MDKVVRNLVWERSKGLCEYCGLPLDEEAWDFHHRKLRSHGGKDSAENGVALHHFCHLVKIHNHPKTSYANGFMVKSTGNPREEKLALYGSIWVYLEAQGTYREVVNA